MRSYCESPGFTCWRLHLQGRLWVEEWPYAKCLRPTNGEKQSASDGGLPRNH